MATDNDNNVDVVLLFQKPIDTAFELVKTFWVERKEVLDENGPGEEPKCLQPLALRETNSETGGSSSSECGLPEEVLNEPLVDDVFEESTEHVATDLLFQQPKERAVELVYTILKSENQLDDLATKSFVDEDLVENVNVDLMFREPTDTSFQLIYTIPLMEDVTILSPEEILAQVIEQIPPPEELDNVVEAVQVDEISEAEFTFSPVKQPSGDEETVTAEVVTVLERPKEDGIGSKEARDVIEKALLTSNDTLDEMDDPEEEEVFQNFFVKSVETPPPEEDFNGDDACFDLAAKETMDPEELVRKLSALSFPVDDVDPVGDTLNTNEEPVSEAYDVEDPSPQTKLNLKEDKASTPVAASGEEVTSEAFVGSQAPTGFADSEEKSDRIVSDFVLDSVKSEDDNELANSQDFPELADWNKDTKTEVKDLSDYVFPVNDVESVEDILETSQEPVPEAFEIPETAGADDVEDPSPQVEPNVEKDSTPVAASEEKVPSEAVVGSQAPAGIADSEEKSDRIFSDSVLTAVKSEDDNKLAGSQESTVPESAIENEDAKTETEVKDLSDDAFPVDDVDLIGDTLETSQEPVPEGGDPSPQTERILEEDKASIPVGEEVTSEAFVGFQAYEIADSEEKSDRIDSTASEDNNKLADSQDSTDPELAVENKDVKTEAEVKDPEKLNDVDSVEDTLNTSQESAPEAFVIPETTGADNVEDPSPQVELNVEKDSTPVAESRQKVRSEAVVGSQAPAAIADSEEKSDRIVPDPSSHVEPNVEKDPTPAAEKNVVTSSEKEPASGEEEFTSEAVGIADSEEKSDRIVSDSLVDVVESEDDNKPEDAPEASIPGNAIPEGIARQMSDQGKLSDHDTPDETNRREASDKVEPSEEIHTVPDTETADVVAHVTVEESVTPVPPIPEKHESGDEENILTLIGHSEVDIEIIATEAEKPAQLELENVTEGEKLAESPKQSSGNISEGEHGQYEEPPAQMVASPETFERVKRTSPEDVPEEVFERMTVSSYESSVPVPHTITDIHFEVPKNHPDFGNDYVPFGTEPTDGSAEAVEFSVPEDNEEEDVVAELNFQPIRQWKDEDVISLQSLKSLVAEVGCTTEEQNLEKDNTEETLKILKVVPSEPSLLELDIANDPNVIHVPIPLMEPATKYLEEMVDWIIADAVKEVEGGMEVVTESELCEMKEESPSCPVPEPLEDMEFPFEGGVDDEKTPEPEAIPETVSVPQRPPRAPKQEPPPKARVRFGPLSIKLGRSYSEEQKLLEQMLERPLEVTVSSSPTVKEPEDVNDDGAFSPLSPGTLAEYEHVPMMDMRSVPTSPQEKLGEKPEEVEEAEGVKETVILSTMKFPEDVGKAEVDDDEGSEYLDSIGDLSERTIQRFNTSIDDPSVRRDSFSSISSFGDRQKFQTAIENIRHDLLPFQSSVSQYLAPSVNPTHLVANLSMDSPSDLSPNAPPVGFENTAQFLERLQAEDRPSAEGSIDSSGFEKVDHEGLDDYPPVADPMQQSVFGSLQANDVAPSLQADDGFVLIDKPEAEVGGDSGKKMSSHDDVIEKNYFGEDSTASATAKLLESPIAEEARKLVQDAVASASEISKQAVDDADEIGKELLDSATHKFDEVKEPVLDNLHQKFDDVKEPVVDTLQKAHDGLGDFVHETVPQAVEDFVQHANIAEPEPAKPTSPVPEKSKTPEPPLLDIHDTVDKVHDEIDSFLRGRDPTPPLEADEDAQEQPHFGNQTPEEDETTFDRKGPLTIPEEVEKAAALKNEDDFSDFDPLATANVGSEFGAAVGEALTEEEMFGHQKFETVPRPPTPPKDISDEDVKPSTVNLGPAHHHSHPSSPHHSILKHHGEAWIDFKTVPPCVLDVIYWRDAKKSAVVLSLALLALFILAKYPLLTVVTYSLLLSLVAAAGFRVFKKVEAQIKKTDAEHPFSEILAQDLSLPQEKVHAQADVFVEHATCIANKLKKLVFVESPVESVKFGVVLWALTYVASWFSGFTIAILALLGVFSVPKVYESNQEAIDPHLATLSDHVKNIQNLIDEKLPFLRSAPVAAEEKKDQ